MSIKLTSGVIAIDNGGSSTCIVTKTTQENFPSVKGLYGNRKLITINNAVRYDYVVDYKGKKYVMGTLAKYDCPYPLQMHTDTKQNIFFDLSVLVAIHQFGYEFNYIIVSAPISMYNEEEKFGIIQRLLGEHMLSVNGKNKKFTIMDVKVAPESAVAFWVEEPVGKNRFIDLGSRTIGYATTIYEGGVNRFIDSESGTFKGKGLEVLNNSYNHAALADYICGRLLSIWDKNDNVFLLGGGALDKTLVEQIKNYFPKAKVMNNPQMANALGMYNLGKIVYEME